ncbi:MAG: hypothetical protein RLZZ385_1500 [Pseudomonadota bacterium]|jgi:cytochrome c peroxidase
MSKSLLRIMGLAVVLPALVYTGWQQLDLPLPEHWTAAELALLETLSLDRLPPPPIDPSNRVADDPRAAALGARLFFDTRLSSTGELSCATCHQPDRWFTDGRKLGMGTAEGDRHTMGLLGVAYSPWHYWDGRKDSLWSQALEPLENPLEHATTRTAVARLISNDPHYRPAFEDLFGALPDLNDSERFPAQASPLGSESQQRSWWAMTAADQHQVSRVFSQVGKVLAAYERQLLPGRAPLDDYLQAVRGNGLLRQAGLLSRAQVAGLRLFIGKAQCINCHNGPLLTNHDFHNTGLLPLPGNLPATGRASGLRLALADPFNCLGDFSDAAPEQCVELRFARVGDENLGAHKTPTLRNVALTAPYMHAGQLGSLEAVLRHYDAAEEALLGHNEAEEPLRLRAVELRQLEQFLHSLTAP